MTLEMVYLNEWFVQRHCQTLGERGADKERAEQSRTACERYCRYIFGLDSRTRNRLTYNRYNIYLMGS